MADVEVAASLLGYQGEVDPAFVAVAHAARCTAPTTSTSVRRAIVDAVPDAVLRMPPQVPALLVEFRADARSTHARPLDPTAR